MLTVTPTPSFFTPNDAKDFLLEPGTETLPAPMMKRYKTIGTSGHDDTCTHHDLHADCNRRKSLDDEAMARVAESLDALFSDEATNRKSVNTGIKPMLAKRYTVGTGGWQHLYHDLHAEPANDLHYSLFSKDVKETWTLEGGEEKSVQAAPTPAPATGPSAKRTSISEFFNKLASRALAERQQFHDAVQARAHELACTAANRRLQMAAMVTAPAEEKPPHSTSNGPAYLLPTEAPWQATPSSIGGLSAQQRDVLPFQAAIQMMMLQQAYGQAPCLANPLLGMGYSMMLPHIMSPLAVAPSNVGQQDISQQPWPAQQAAQPFIPVQQMQASSQPVSAQPAPAPVPQRKAPPSLPAIVSKPVKGVQVASHIAFGELVATASCQEGSRQLQKELPKMSDAQLVRVREELEPHILALAKHPFGNYTVSKLVHMAQMHSALTEAFHGHVMELLVHPQGSRVLQEAMASLPAASVEMLVSEVQGHVSAAARNTHASWGICAAFKRTHATYILAEVASDVVQLSLHQDGVRVVQRVLAEAAASSLDISDVVATLMESDLPRLARHEYGNYALQVALRHSQHEQQVQMIALLQPYLLELSTNKHGSNVSEMVLQRMGATDLEHLRAQLFDAPEGRQILRKLLNDSFANYVLKSLVRLLPPAEREKVLQIVADETTTRNYGRAIMTAHRVTNSPPLRV